MRVSTTPACAAGCSHRLTSGLGLISKPGLISKRKVTKDRRSFAIALGAGLCCFRCPFSGQPGGLQPFAVGVKCFFGSRVLAQSRRGFHFPDFISRLALLGGEYAG